MTQEQTAARLIAVTEFAPESKIGILGFGGRNGHYNAETNPQPPVDQVCPMTEVNTPANRQLLSDCIGKLKKRRPKQGNHTDFIDAIKGGVANLVSTRDTGRPLLLFLLTDGKLDMVGSPGFAGSSNDAINAKGNHFLITRTLPAAKAAGVRIWPLGFEGSEDLGELKTIAADGYQGSCDEALPDATPHALTVASAGGIEQELLQIFANARCLGYSKYTSALIGPGDSANLYAKVPDIATSGWLEVIRQTPQISVSYFDPAGQQVPPTGTLAEQTLSLAGADSSEESLSVSNPIPGRWRVHVAAAPGAGAGELVTVSALWQGVLHSDIVTDPADPAPGQAVTVTVKLQIRTRSLSASDLANVHVSVRVSGPGVTTPISVQVNDEGVPPDQTARDGVYAGTFTVPKKATGTLTAEGVVSAQGVKSDAHVARITVDSNDQLVTGQMTLPTGEVARSGQVTGTVQLRNPTGQPHTIRLAPVDTPAGVTITPSTVSLPAGSDTKSLQFTVNFACSVPLGAMTGHVNASDAITGLVYAQSPIKSQVIKPPVAVKAQATNYHWGVVGLIVFALFLTGLALWVGVRWAVAH